MSSEQCYSGASRLMCTMLFLAASSGKMIPFISSDLCHDVKITRISPTQVESGLSLSIFFGFLTCYPVPQSHNNPWFIRRSPDVSVIKAATCHLHLSSLMWNNLLYPTMKGKTKDMILIICVRGVNTLPPDIKLIAHIKSFTAKVNC